MNRISEDIKAAAQLLTDGQLVAIPTETVYGLAGNIFNDKAIRSIFEMKQRPLFNPLIVHIGKLDQLKAVTTAIPAKAKLLMDAFWPGALTLVLPKSSIVPELITAGKPTVAVRMPDHDVTRELLHLLEFPLAAPSANPFGRISPTRPEHVDQYFGDEIKLILNGGDCKKGIESTIIGFENEKPIIYRLGSISQEQIEAVVGKIPLKTKEEVSPDAPGMLERHYAPLTKTILVDNVDESLRIHSDKEIGLLTLKPVFDKSVHQHEYLTANANIEEAMANVYACLHRLDRGNCDLIIIERLPDSGLGKSINDRLERATK